MPHKYVSSTMFTTPMGVVRWVRLQLKSIEKLSHETAPPVLLQKIHTLEDNGFHDFLGVF